MMPPSCRGLLGFLPGRSAGPRAVLVVAGVTSPWIVRVKSSLPLPFLPLGYPPSTSFHCRTKLLK